MDKEKTADEIGKEIMPESEVNTSGPETLPEGALKKITLPSGKTAIIFEGKGVHSNQAMEIANGGKKYLNALMSLLIEIEGEKMLPEEMENLPLKDYLALQGEFAEQNF